MNDYDKVKNDIFYYFDNGLHTTQNLATAMDCFYLPGSRFDTDNSHTRNSPIKIACTNFRVKETKAAATIGPNTRCKKLRFMIEI